MQFQVGITLNLTDSGQPQLGFSTPDGTINLSAVALIHHYLGEFLERERLRAVLAEAAQTLVQPPQIVVPAPGEVSSLRLIRP